MDLVIRHALRVEYEEYGEGEPVLLIHGGIIGAYYWRPVIDEMLAAAPRRLIALNRRGFGGSSPGSEPVTVEEEAEDLKLVLDALGLERAHVVGHSYGGWIGLTLATKYPNAVRTLALLESSPFAGVPSGAEFLAEMARKRKVEAPEGLAANVDFALRTICGSNYRDYLRPGWWEQVLADASSLAPRGTNMATWAPPVDLLARINMPVLIVLGGESHNATAFFPDGHALLKDWFPHAQEYVLPHSTHALTLMNPGGLAGALNDFFARTGTPA